MKLYAASARVRTTAAWRERDSGACCLSAGAGSVDRLLMSLSLVLMLVWRGRRGWHE